MATSTESLWGTLPSLEEKINTPKRILQEQAQILSDATQHLLVGEVKVSGEMGDIFVSLYIVAPTLNNYRVEVVKVQHGALAYPASVSDRLENSYVYRKCPDESALRVELSRILGSEKAHSVVKSLLSQAADEVEESSIEGEIEVEE